MWKIYYDDESVITNDDMSWEDVPLYGVLFVVENYTERRRIVHMGMDYYMKKNNTIISCNDGNIKMHIELGLSARCTKFGRWAPDDIWDRVHNIVFMDR